MKKKFLNFFMIGALAMAGSVGMVSCSDYDDDINQINEQLKSDKATFNQQLAALQTALEQAKKDAATAAAAAEEAAKKYAEAQAAGALEEAKVYAETVAKEEAKAAAAAAKAEAIEEAKKLIEAAILECKNACSENMAALRTEMIAAIAIAQAEANGYTDAQIAQLTSTILEKIAEAQKAGNDYTDAEIAKLHEAISAEIAAKISDELAKQYTQVTADIEAAIAAGKGYTDAQIASLSELLGAQIEGIQKDLDLLNADEKTAGSIKYQIAAAKADLQVQIDALAKYADLLDDLSKTYPALKDAVAQNTKDVAALKSQLEGSIEYFNTLIDGLQDQLNDLKPLVGVVDGIETRVSAIEGQITTLQGLINGLTSRLSTLEGTVGTQGETISQLQETLRQLDGAINAANLLIGTNTENISALKTELTNLKTSLEGVIGAEVTTIHTLVMVRLTSMQYIPNYFIGGIETILFENFEYIPQMNNDQGVLAEAIVEGEGDGLEAGTIYKPLDTEVSYRLNPSGVNENTLDLAKMKFMCSTATAITRAGEEVIAPIADSWTIENGSVLKFKVKQVAEKLRNGDGNVVDIVCLQMPLKGEALAKGETEAYVYSDYAQVRSTAETVKFYVGSALEGHKATSALPIKMNPDSIEAFSDPRKANKETTIYQVEVPMAGEINLADSVCVIMQHADQTSTVWTKADLERAGFTVRFDKPAREYKPEGSSQDHMQYLKEVTPEGVVTFENATAAKGRTPVVRCRVMDGEQVVTEAYFRLKIGGNVVVNLTAEASLVLSSEPGAMTMNLGVKELTEKFYNVLGIAQSELETWKMTVESEGERVHTSWFEFDKDGNYALTIPVRKDQPEWLSTKVWANTELGGVVNNYGSKRKTTATVKFASNNGDVLTIDFTMIIKRPYYTIGYLETPWVGGIAGITNVSDPKQVDEGVIMANPSPISTQYGKHETTKYVFNVYDGFNMNDAETAPKVKVTDADGNVLSEIAEIDSWLDKGYGFHWNKPEVAYMVETQRDKALEYYLPEVSAANKAANTIENAVDFREIGANGNWGVDVARTYIEGCEAADAVKPEFKLYATLPISVIVDGGEPTDQMVIGKYAVRFVKPLHIAGVDGKYWIDARHDKQTLSIDQLLTITDWKGKAVELVSGNKFWNFYNVEYCKFEFEEVNNVKVAKVTTSLYEDGVNIVHKDGYSEGKLPTNVAVIVNENGDLEYQNSGNLTQMPYDIYVPVSIEHKWGKETVKVKIHIKPAE